ncbi:MAG: hypothetical protein WCC06_09665 [Candidatus Aminicenantales bacterium]
MKKYAFGVFFVLIGIGLMAYAEQESKSTIQYYHGLNMPKSFMKILYFSPEMIWFEIRCDRHGFIPGQHLILDGNDIIAERIIWHGRSSWYRIKLEPIEGKKFEFNKKYRLCIGIGYPLRYPWSGLVLKQKCLAEYDFVLTETEANSPIE